MTIAKIMAGVIKAAKNQGRQPNFGAMKTKLEKKVREGTATKEDKELLKELRKKDASATMSQKVRQSQSSRQTPVSLPGSKRVGGTQKSYGGGMKKKTVKRQAGGGMSGKPKGVGCAKSGYGKAMK